MEAAAGSKPAAAPRIGVDLVRIDDIAESVRCFGDRYLRRVFTPREIADCRTAEGLPEVERLAARYAAKEAILKVLRPVRHWFNWQQIEIVREDGGWVGLRLHGAAREHAMLEELRHFAVSLSHERDYAIATVIGSA